MSMVGFPLLLIPLAIYNIIVWLMPGVSLAEPLIKLTLMSGAEWSIDLSDILLALGVFLLLLEVIKGARPGAKYLTDHLLSLIVFGAAAAEFLLWPRFGNSTYFLLALLSLADFLSRHCAARAARNGAGRGRGLEAQCPGACCRTRTARRSRARARHRRQRPGRRSPAAGSRRAEGRTCRSHAGIAGGHLAGIAAERRLPALTGYAAALIP